MEGDHHWRSTGAAAEASTSQAYDSFHDFSLPAGVSDAPLPGQESQLSCELGQRCDPVAGLGDAGSQFYTTQQMVGIVAHAIYLCDPRTEEECLSRSLLGLPASQAQVVQGIVPELSLLFLFNVRAFPIARP